MNHTPDGRTEDEKLLAEFGYKQELHRGMRLWSAFALGVAAISPVVGIFAVMSLGYATAGPSWVWVVPLCMVMQLSIATVYAELSSQFPIAGGAYQWVRRLVGDRWGWFTGFLYMAAVTAALTTVAYLGGYWLYLLFTNEAPTAIAQVACGAIFLVLALVVNLLGVNPLKYVLSAGIIAEAIASVGIGVILLVFFRNNSFSLLFDSLGATGDKPYWTGFLAALAVGGWAFLGFDSVAQVSEETVNPRRFVPRAIRTSLVVVGSVVVLTSFAVTLSYPDPQAVTSGQVIDPVTPSVVSAFGDWAEKPFVFVVLVSFICCAMAIQTYLSRSVFSMARDEMLPGHRALSRVNRHRAPVGAMWVTTALAAAFLLLGVNGTAVGTLISFGTGGFFIIYLIVACAALYTRTTGRWDPSKGQLFLGRRGLIINVIAVAWLAFETINVAWPREILNPPGAPAFQLWAVPIVFGLVAVIGVIYMAVAKPHTRIQQSEAFSVNDADLVGDAS